MSQILRYEAGSCVPNVLMTDRLKDFLRPRRGIATRYLDNYLSWFHLVGLAPGANDRACLAAAVTS